MTRLSKRDQRASAADRAERLCLSDEWHNYSFMRLRFMNRRRSLQTTLKRLNGKAQPYRTADGEAAATFGVAKAGPIN